MPKRRSNREGSLFQRKRDGYWVASVWDPERKKQIQVTRKKHADALAVLKEMTRRVDDGDAPTDSAMTFEQVYVAWRKTWPMDKQKTPSTRRTYDNTASNSVLPHLGSIPVRSIRRHHIDDMLAELNSKGLAGSSMKTALTVCRGVFKYARANRWMTADPMTDLPSPSAKPKRPKDLPTQDQNRELLEKASPQLRLMLSILTFTGCRAGEALGLTIADVDRVEKTISIVGTRYKLPGETNQKHKPKNDAGARVIGLLPGLEAEIDRFNAAMTVQRISGWLVCWPDGSLVDYSTLARELRDLRGPATGLTFGSWRHLAATVMMERDVPDVVAAAALGHSVTVMRQVYSHARKDQVNRAIEALGGN